MQNAPVSNPNDFKVISFHNSTVFGFTPEMGCMYDGRAINGKNGSPGIDAGETMILPYHIANRLAINLAKRVFNTSPAATVDPAGIPTGVPIWSENKLNELAKSYLTELYSESKPIAQSQTDILMAKVEEFRAKFEALEAKIDSKDSVTSSNIVEDKKENSTEQKTLSNVYTDKQEVILELEKRGIAHDKRQNKATLEKLLI